MVCSLQNARNKSPESSHGEPNSSLPYVSTTFRYQELIPKLRPVQAFQVKSLYLANTSVLHVAKVTEPAIREYIGHWKPLQ